ncbi:MAG: hypothetical protein GXO73_07180 [Calditrichaeota bacterium]|nr:hypothetical protein [Calditrichota bacterium]
MKILFSEHQPDYAHYIFPYAIWAIREPNEPAAAIFARGFLPSTRDLSRFYMCRQVRVALSRFKPSSENRRILRKGGSVTFRLMPREEFDYTPAWRDFCKTYADIRFGKDVMTEDRLDSLFRGQIVSHVLLFTDQEAGKDVGLATLYLEEPTMAFYYYAFYDLNYYPRNLGMFMMTSAVDFFARRGFEFIYLGSCYSRNALYKTQFAGVEFWTGFRWSTDLEELKYMLKRGQTVSDRHLLETEEYLERFYGGDLQAVLDSAEV